MTQCAQCSGEPLRYPDGMIKTFYVNALGGSVPLCRQHAVERKVLYDYEYTAAEALWLASREVPKGKRVAIVMASHPPIAACTKATKKEAR